MSKKIHPSKLGSEYRRHPDNRFGQGSAEFWEAEYKLWGMSQQEYHQTAYSQTTKCPHCGIPYGYAPGTGDCGCGDRDYE